MPIRPGLEKINEEWKGDPSVLIAGLEKMRKLLNALVNKVSPLGGNGNGDTGNPQNVYVVAADAETGFIRVFHAVDGNLTLGTEITADEDL